MDRAVGKPLDRVLMSQVGAIRGDSTRCNNSLSENSLFSEVRDEQHMQEP